MENLIPQISSVFPFLAFLALITGAVLKALFAVIEKVANKTGSAETIQQMGGILDGVPLRYDDVPARDKKLILRWVLDCRKHFWTMVTIVLILLMIAFTAISALALSRTGAQDEGRPEFLIGAKSKAVTADDLRSIYNKGVWARNAGKTEEAIRNFKHFLSLSDQGKRKPRDMSPDEFERLVKVAQKNIEEMEHGW